ncbi:hypothetical protein MNO09_00325 (plasmid) [Bacillus sp. N5-665]|uniref:restriction endonuclease-related protein n=1 Tax=Bacillus sp. N5-665 TaxID=2925318 RepID=UPI001F536C46|nr:hypothetical protein [Bacillus sp. N5-665]UNK30990.1 hypothetical protein MNO09_00325 [Bacillus sp. N5-665]
MILGIATYDRLIEIIEQAKMLEEDITRIVYVLDDSEAVIEFERFFKKLQGEFLRSKGSKYPCNLYEFLTLLRTPIKEWGYFNMNSIKERRINENLILLGERVGVTSEALHIYNEHKNAYEAQTKAIEDVIRYCREKSIVDKTMQQKYEFFRNYLIEHPLIHPYYAENEIAEGLDNDSFLINKLLEECYEPIIGEYEYICPSCGWTLQQKALAYFYCLSNDCRESYDKNNVLTNQNLINLKVTHRTKEAIQRTTVIPGKKEIELAHRLGKKGVTVNMYPAIEAKGDIRAEKIIHDKRVSLYIDVKDYSSEYVLAQRLIMDKEAGILKDVLIAVPDKKANKKYLKAVKRILLEKEANEIEVYSFREIINMFADSKKGE